jgi:hypothetical protein
MKVEIQSGDEQTEWPEAVKRRFIYLTDVAYSNHFSVLCAVGLHHGHKRLSVFFSPTASENPDMAEMCDDIAELFQHMARRLRQ